MKTPKISLVVVCHNMVRELPRTLFTLQPPYQHNLSEDDIEIIVVDNGSSQIAPTPETHSNIKVLSVKDPTHSPVQAVNLGLKSANAPLIGVLIDGARMASPGLLSFALKSSMLYERPVISTLGFHLGPEVQMRSIEKGYSQEVEDALLDSVPWESDGYELFGISEFAGSSSGGWFRPIAESNAIFLTNKMWAEMNGYDDSFKTPGGGLVNLDTYVRACNLPDSELVTLLGEGTFHQVHGGIATNQKSPDATWDIFHNEYKKIRGKQFSAPTRNSTFLGTLTHHHLKSLQLSVGAISN